MSTYKNFVKALTKNDIRAYNNGVKAYILLCAQIKESLKKC